MLAFSVPFPIAAPLLHKSSFHSSPVMFGQGKNKTSKEKKDFQKQKQQSNIDDFSTTAKNRLSELVRKNRQSFDVNSNTRKQFNEKTSLNLSKDQIKRLSQQILSSEDPNLSTIAKNYNQTAEKTIKVAQLKQLHAIINKKIFHDTAKQYKDIHNVSLEISQIQDWWYANKKSKLNYFA